MGFLKLLVGLIEAIFKSQKAKKQAIVKYQRRIQQIERNANGEFYIVLSSYRIINETNDVGVKLGRVKTIQDPIKRMIELAENNLIEVGFSLQSLLSEIIQIEERIESGMITLQQVLTEKGRLEPVCPNCGYRFDEFPKRKRKCPECKVPIIRYKNTEKQIFLITDSINDNIKQIEAEIISMKLYTLPMDDVIEKERRLMEQR